MQTIWILLSFDDLDIFSINSSKVCITQTFRLSSRLRRTLISTTRLRVTVTGDLMCHARDKVTAADSSATIYEPIYSV